MTIFQTVALVVFSLNLHVILTRSHVFEELAIITDKTRAVKSINTDSILLDRDLRKDPKLADNSANDVVEGSSSTLEIIAIVLADLVCVAVIIWACFEKEALQSQYEELRDLNVQVHREFVFSSSPTWESESSEAAVAESFPNANTPWNIHYNVFSKLHSARESPNRSLMLFDFFRNRVQSIKSNSAVVGGMYSLRTRRIAIRKVLTSNKRLALELRGWRQEKLASGIYGVWIARNEEEQTELCGWFSMAPSGCEPPPPRPVILYDNASGDGRCCVCCVGETDSVLVPCGHVLCNGCAHLVRSCPICRSAVCAVMPCVIDGDGELRLDTPDQCSDEVRQLFSEH